MAIFTFDTAVPSYTFRSNRITAQYPATGGATLRLRHRRLSRTAAQAKLSLDVTITAHDAWDQLSPAEKATWVNPSGSVNLSRRYPVSPGLHGWRNFILAHAYERWYRDLYIASDPTSVPGITVLLDTFVPLWTVDLLSFNLSVDWTVPPTSEQALVVYQVNPIAVNKPGRIRYTRLLTAFTDFTYPDEHYTIGTSLPFHVDPQAYLQLLSRFRLSGGYTAWALHTIQRP